MASAYRSLIAACAFGLMTAVHPILAPTANAQSAVIIVEVNEDIITNVDVEQRERLLSFGAGRQLPNARPLAIEALIEDALKLQEAERLGIEISADDVAAAVETIARNNRITVDELIGAMASAGVELWAFQYQLRAEIAWTRIIRRRYGDSLDPSEGEIEAAIRNAISGEDTYSLAQIVVPAAQGASQSEIESAMARLMELRAEMTSCAETIAIAERLGPPSGDIGQTQVAQMPPPVREAVTGLDVGEIADPIRSNVGIHLMMVCDIERAGGADRDRITAQLRQEKGLRISESYLSDLRRSALITALQ